jgi:phosphoglycerate dehydrogenase-like enzyme
MPHVLMTPHIAGETQRYEDKVIEILDDNWRGDERLRNDVV